MAVDFQEKYKIAPITSSRLESVFAKIPDLGDKIIRELDNPSLVKCKEVQRSWYSFINNGKIIWFRKIQNCIGNKNKFSKTWKKVLMKAPFDFVMQVAIASQQAHAKYQISLISPIHMAAGEVLTVKVTWICINR